MPAPPPLGPGLITRRVRISDADVVWLRAVIEAYDGLAFTYGDGSGVVELAAPACRAGELDALLNELAAEVALSPAGRPTPSDR
ncbi:MAG: DUF4911 domain-containing protein [Myxococcales bacterium]|nr:DUF4911 domain-containing protein [Myxococcales bacterium]